MSTRSRQRGIGSKRRQVFADVSQLARVNPDALARNLLHPKRIKNSQQRREIWDLFQQLGGNAVIRRAADSIHRARESAELQAVLQAAMVDNWFEIGPALAQRFHREAQRVAHGVPSAESIARIQALSEAAVGLNAPLAAADLRILLKTSSSRLREIAAGVVAASGFKELAGDCLPLCWERGLAHNPAADAVGKLGTEEHAQELWRRALAARRAGRLKTLIHLLRPLAEMGVFDIHMALRVWIEDDAARSPSDAWAYAEIWSRLTAARFAAGDCERGEAIDQLHWFIELAGPYAQSAKVDSRPHGYFFVADELARLGASRDAEALLTRFAVHGLPDPELFPKLLFPGLRKLVAQPESGVGLLWLAASGERSAQNRLLSNWQGELLEGGTPENWSLHARIDPAALVSMMRRSLRSRAPGVLRHILSLPMSSELAAKLKPQIARLAKSHASKVVRWKARRVLSRIRAAKSSQATRDIRWMRLDAAVLAGAHRSRVAKAVQVHAQSGPIAGIITPARAGRGYRLQFEALPPELRALTVKALLTGPLERALDREIPLGPSLEDRPDFKSIRELAPPSNDVDRRMIELAQAVINYWSDADDLLTLDEDGVGMVSTALAADIRSLDEEDIEACGAFIGEALRKALGGQWSGYDGNYLLEAGGELLDPLGWVREVYTRKDAIDGAEMLVGRFAEAVARLKKPPRVSHHVDPSAACARIVSEMCEDSGKPMADLLSEARALSYRFEHDEWSAVLAAMDPLIGNPAGNRVLAAIALYAPHDIFAHLWSQWGRHRREESGLADAIVEAMSGAAERDDLEAMPNWTAQPGMARLSFLNPLRKRMDAVAWRKVLMLLLRQRAAAGDRAGVGWCLFSYRYEFQDCLPLAAVFCSMSVIARQTVLRATLHCTRDETRLFRPLWAEALRDPAPVVVLAALDAISSNRARSLRPLVTALSSDSREEVRDTATNLLQLWQG
jgi:hypothetical protein